MRAITQSGLLLLLSLAGVLAAPQKPGCHKVKETVHVPHGWVQHGDPHPDHKIVLKVGLPQPNFDILEKHLYEVSDPTHPRYGDHLTKEQVEELVAPHKESVDLVDEWLQAHGIDINALSRSPAKDWVTVTVPVSLAEKMLDTKYYVYKHTSSGDSIVRTTSYSLPEELHEHVDVIQPTTMFGQFKALKTTFVFDSETPAAPGLAALSKTVSTPVDPSCNTTITIKCLQQLYNTVGFTPSAKGNSIGITGYLEQFANLQDLETFYEEQRPDAAGTSFKFVSVNGGLNNQTLEEAGAEANLDVQFAYGLSYPIPGTFWSTGGRPPFNPDIGTPTNTNEPYAEWLDYILKQKDIPHAISTSYGDHEQTVPKSYAIRTCAQFAQLGARGVSLTFSSGDGGVGDNESDPAQQTCFTNDGKNTTRFIPLFPASCPFVTAIGGTQNINPEVAVSRFGSGGGFSDYFPRPLYQEAAVSGFLKKLGKDTYKGLFNRNGRGIPDVAAQGDRYRIWLAGVPRSIGGTSASSPTFAGIVALLNDARLSAGKKPLGWLNPLIYSAAANDFTDITSGKNPGCGTEGFNATVGWDPVTGLGTPDFQKLKTTVLKHWF